ncbi:lactonase family protein [uncultured Aquimarina sp.]|uniref:lactonase family protein n=1 Tax=uncultured Aquimarina sp. TaxID=575652 RepID=UPI00262D805B|nr:lactonase family protein [uncultured Aquimarina sp.]
MSILFIGSYTEMITPNFGGSGIGISTLELNDQTGELKLLHSTKTKNAGYLTISNGKQFLYTFTEVVQEKKPTVKAFRILKDYSLEFINEIHVNGSLPCHISYHNNAVFIACYGTGNILKYSTNSEGKLVQETHNFVHSGKSINIERQEAPHAHQVVIHPNNKHLFVPDLGIDSIKVYNLETNFSAKNGLDIPTNKGFGPRHIVFQKEGRIGYVISELTGKIGILKEENNIFKIKKYVNSLPKDFTKTPSASAIRIHPNNIFLYVANRTLDALTIFKIVDDDLELIDYQSTNGNTLREFNISPDGTWLIACLQDSNETIAYQINTDGKLLEKHRTNLIKSGVCVAFL